MKYVFAILFVFLIISCNKNNEMNKEVQIRLKNNSNVKFESASFNNTNYGSLNPGEVSQYEAFDEAHDYGLVQIIINGQEYGWIPIDFVGEKPLESGKYTFEYNFDEVNKILTDEFIID